MALSRSRSSTPYCPPDDLYYLAPGFPADRLTVAEIKKILLKHHISSADCTRKADFVALFKTKVLPKREKILKKYEDAAEAAELAIRHDRFLGDEESSDNDASADNQQTTGDSDDDEAPAPAPAPATGKRKTSGWSTILDPLLKSMSSSEPSSGPAKSHQTTKQPTPSPMPKLGARSTLFNPLSNTISFSEPSSGPCKSYWTFKQPIPSPMPFTEPSSGPYKPRPTFEEPTPSASPAPELRALSEQLEELGSRITNLELNIAQAFRAQFQQTKTLEMVVGELEGFIDGEQGSLNALGKAGKKAGMQNGHGHGKGKGKGKGKERAGSFAVAAADEEEEL